MSCGVKRAMNHDRKKQDKKHRVISCVLIGIICMFIILAFVGCKAPGVTSGGMHRQAHDSVRTEYIHDSVYVDRWHKQYVKGDTVYIHDSIDRWRDRKVYIHDSIDNSRIDTVYQPIEVEKKGSAFLHGSGIAFWVLIAIITIAGAVGLIIKFAK